MEEYTFLTAIVQYMEEKMLPDDQSLKTQVQDIAQNSEIRTDGLLGFNIEQDQVSWLPDHLQIRAMDVARNNPLTAHGGFFKPLKHL